MKRMASKVARKVMQLASCMKYKEALDMSSKYKVKNLTVTRATLKNKYGLKPKDIEKLHHIEVDNPHFKNAGKMRLYLRAEAYYYSLKKKRSKESKKYKLP